MTTFIISFEVKEPTAGQTRDMLKRAGWSEWFADNDVDKELPNGMLWQNNAGAHSRAVRATLKALITQSGAELTKLIVIESSRWAGISDVERAEK